MTLDAATDAFRLKLLQYKTRCYLSTCAIKACKRELKSIVTANNAVTSVSEYGKVVMFQSYYIYMFNWHGLFLCLVFFGRSNTFSLEWDYIFHSWFLRTRIICLYIFLYISYSQILKYLWVYLWVKIFANENDYKQIIFSLDCIVLCHQDYNSWSLHHRYYLQQSQGYHHHQLP